MKKKQQVNKTDINDSLLSIQSEIEGREKCREILKNNTGIKKGESGGFKDTRILGNNDFIKFSSAKDDDDDDLFDRRQCFYYALSRTIEDVKGIKFIGKDVQRFAGDDLLKTFNKDTKDKTLACLCLIAFLLSEIDGNRYETIKEIVIEILAYIENKTTIEIKSSIFLDITMKEHDIFYKATEQEKLELSRELCRSLLKPVYKHLDDTIKIIDDKGQKIINKFLCQLFFLIFFTNKIDIKPQNILVQQDNDNMEFLHIDFDEPREFDAMFDTFDRHEQYNFYYGKYFLESLWNKISSDELSEYFNEYIKKYTLTEEKLKKIISRTVKNVFRQKYNFDSDKHDKISRCLLKQTCEILFEHMQKYMQYMLKQLSEKKILLQGGNNKKIETLIKVLENNRKALSDMLQGDKIKKCVEESIDRYKKLKKEVLEEKQPKQSNENINNPANPSTHSNNDSNKQDNEFNIDNDINLDDIKKEINNSNINEQKESLNEMIGNNFPLSYSHTSVDKNNKSDINNDLNINKNIPKEETNKTNNIYQGNNNNLNNNTNNLIPNLNINNNINDTQKEKTKGTIIINPINNNIINISLNNSEKKNNDSLNIKKRDIIISDNTEKNSQMTSCGEIWSNIKDFFTQCCSNCGTNDRADINTSSVQVDNTRNI